MLHAYRFFITSILLHAIILVILITVELVYQTPKDRKLAITLIPQTTNAKIKNNNSRKEKSQLKVASKSPQISKAVSKEKLQLTKEQKIQKSVKPISKKPMSDSKEEVAKTNLNKNMMKAPIIENNTDTLTKSQPQGVDQPVMQPKQQAVNTPKAEPNSKKNIVVKNNDFLKLLEQTTAHLQEQKNDDIMQSQELTDQEKHILHNNLAGCAIYLADIRDYDIVIKLKLIMHPDARISQIDVLSINSPVDSIDKNILASRIIDMFKLPQCAQLDLPEGKYYFWKEFTVNLTLKSFFE